MRCLRLEIEGFRAFRQRTTYDFPEEAGLWLVKGRNDADPEISPNGCGKSTFWDAIDWILFGSTSRGLGAGHVQSWGVKHTEGQLTLEIGGAVHEIVRTRGPITLLLDGETVEQSRINELLGFDHSGHLHVQHFAQFSELFPDLKATARLDQVSKVLDLDSWAAASKAASKKVQALERDVSERERGLEFKRGRLVEMNRRLEEAGSAYLEADKRLTDALHAKAKRLDEAERELADLRRELGLETSKKSKLEDKVEASNRRLGELEKARRERREERIGIEADLGHSVSRRDALEARLKGFDKLDEKDCPTCGQDVDSAVLNGLRRDVRKERDELNVVCERLADDRREVVREIAEDDENIRKVDEDLQGVGRRLDEIGRTVQRLSSSRAALEREVSSLLDECEVLERGTVDEQDKFDDLTQEVVDLDEEIGVDEFEMLDVASELEFLREWPRLFKELRLWVVDSALAELEIHVNSSLVELGLVGWRIEFVVERETKSGTIARGFEILVHAPEAPAGVPWEGWSGGETQRLRIACAVGFANLVRSRMPDAPLVEVWDEPTEHLSRGGVEDLVEFLSSRADDRQVWIVDHRSLDSGAFDGTVTVVKDEHGARLEV